MTIRNGWCSLICYVNCIYPAGLFLYVYRSELPSNYKQESFLLQTITFQSGSFFFSFWKLLLSLSVHMDFVISFKKYVQLVTVFYSLSFDVYQFWDAEENLWWRRHGMHKILRENSIKWTNKRKKIHQTQCNLNITSPQFRRNWNRWRKKNEEEEEHAIERFFLKKIFEESFALVESIFFYVLLSLLHRCIFHMDFCYVVFVRKCSTFIFCHRISSVCLFSSFFLYFCILIVYYCKHQVRLRIWCAFLFWCKRQIINEFIQWMPMLLVNDYKNKYDESKIATTTT